MLRVDTAPLEQLRALWQQAPEITAEEMSAAVLEGEMLMLREIKELTPVGATGVLRESFHAEAPQRLADSVIGVVGTSQAHAVPVELGTRPHFPPMQPLIDWVRYKLDVKDDDQAFGVALSIARKIAARGTLAVGMVHRALSANEHQVLHMQELALDRIVDRLGGAHG